MNAGETVRQIQGLLDVEQDGQFGPRSLAELHVLVTSAPDSPWPLPAAEPAEDGTHQVLATSFADPKDVAAYRQAKAEGHSEQYALSVGDNGIGCWGDDVTGSTPACALPPELWLAKWGGHEEAHNKPVMVHANGKEVLCLLQDTMPHLENIKNGAGIDLNPAAVEALGLAPPLKAQATWAWG